MQLFVILEQVHGVIPILINAKNDIEKIYGFEIQDEIAEMATRSVVMNDMSKKIEIINEDIRNLHKNEWNKKFDIVVTNPPYKKINTGLINESEQKIISRHEVKCTLEDIMFTSSKILKDNGLFYMVHRSERLVDILTEMRKYKIEPKELKFVYPKKNDDSNLILIKGVKCGKAFLKVKNPLIVYDENNKYSDEILNIYKKDNVKNER